MSVFIHQNESFKHCFTEFDFDISHWQQDPHTIQLTGGRGASFKVIIQNQPLVLRHYLRGGMVAALLKDQYLWRGISNSRPFREQWVIKHALQHHLPVPEVVAFMLRKKGLYYRAAIISRFIPNQGTLAGWLYEHPLDNHGWQQIGGIIRCMHDAGIEHVDLNANNILIDKEMRFHLIDFDKATIKNRQGSWTSSNLSRLLRSLHKIQKQREMSGLTFHFNQQHWQALLQGYHEPDESIQDIDPE